MKEISLRKAREDAGLSLREAAASLGISHAYLSGMELGHKSLLPDRAEQIAKLYGLSSARTLIQPIAQDKESFVLWEREQIRWWDSRFVLPTIPAITRLLSDLFVDPSFRNNQNDTITKNQFLRDLFTDEENRAAVITGNIGTGKSVFLRMLTLETEAMLASTELSVRVVPIFVSLGEFQLGHDPLQVSLVKYFISHGFRGSELQLEKFFQQTFERGDALLLFDGLDEIRDHTQRVEMLARIQQCFEDYIRPKGNKLIIAGRADAFFERDKKYKGFQFYSIRRWHASQMFTGCTKWSWEEDKNAQRFWAIIQSNESLYTLARWPLIFHLLTTLYSAMGLGAFQDLSALCDECCQVLENSWHNARRTFQTQDSGQDPKVFGEQLTWLKWRHFLIQLMEKAVDTALATKQDVVSSFGLIQMHEAWQDFLKGKGVEKNSILHSQLEGFIVTRARIGPLFYHRELLRDAEGTRVSEKFSFLDPIFRDYYIAKALINNPERLKQLLVSHLRLKDWRRPLTLAIQELTRSDRSFEHNLGESLIQHVCSLDDSLHLAHGHHVGNFGLLLATRAVVSANLNKYWDSIVQPYLELYMNSIFERDVASAFNVLGTYSASSRVREYFEKQFYEVSSLNAASSSTDKRWRIIAAMAKLGINSIDTSREMKEYILGMVKKGLHERTETERISTRRIFWSLRQVGRSFMSVPEGVMPTNKQQSASVDSLRFAIMSFVGAARTRFEEELIYRGNSSQAFQPWDELSVIIQTQDQLYYHEDLKETINQIIKTVLINSDAIFGRYPYEMQLLQFLKASLRHSYMIDGSTLDALKELLMSVKANARPSMVAQFEVLLVIIDAREELAQESSSEHQSCLNEYKSKNSDISRLMQELQRHEEKALPDYAELGEAVSHIKNMADRLDEKNITLRIEIAKKLLTLLTIELSLPPEVKDHWRFFTPPFTDLGLPLYDHIYNCLVEVSRRTPLQLVQ